MIPYRAIRITDDEDTHTTMNTNDTHDSHTTVHATTRFSSLHCWPEAPPEVAYLADPHRHEFHVRVEVPVRHADRDIEFILLKQFIDDVIEGLGLTPNAGTKSCEQMATQLRDEVEREYEASGVSVTVSEDGENGATVHGGTPE